MNQSLNNTWSYVSIDLLQNVTTGHDERRYYDNEHNIELLHDGIHDWVGGDMGKVPFSAFDPIFWMHHTFIDYMWEVFRKHQIKE